MKAKFSFPEPGWYSRGSKNTLFKWDGKNWTGETSMYINADPAEHAEEIKELKREIKAEQPTNRIAKVGLPLLFASSGAAAAIWYLSRKNN